MKTIVESIKSNNSKVNESSNFSGIDVLSVKDLYDIFKKNPDMDFADLEDDINDIVEIDLDNNDDVKILELIRDHCLVIGPEGGYDGNGMGFYDVLNMYKLKIAGVTPDDDDDYDEYDFDYIFGVDMAEPLPRKWLTAIKKVNNFDCKYASYYIVSGYEFPCIICFDVNTPVVKRFAAGIESWG